MTASLARQLLRSARGDSVMRVSLARHLNSVRQSHILARAALHHGRTAITTETQSFTYGDLLQHSQHVAAGLDDMAGRNVAVMAGRSFEYAAAKFGVWRAGAAVVPMCESHPEGELSYVLSNADCAAVLCEERYADSMRPVAEKAGVEFILLPQFEPLGPMAASDVKESLSALPSQELLKEGRLDPALLVYTSGTTGPPKGVVLSHANLEAQITCLVDAWHWSSSDRLLHVLPLHHLHGIVNVLLCGLWSGACVDMRTTFDADDVWASWRQGTPTHNPEQRHTLFMAVPTIYSRLVKSFDAMTPDVQAASTAAVKNSLRLMVCGSAALPDPIMKRWEEVSGHRLLERYGMTEIGMALSNPYWPQHGSRLAGHVGLPLPGVQVRIVATGSSTGEEVADGVSGDLQVRGPGVFVGYYNNAAGTASEFTADGWFKTGDVAARTARSSPGSQDELEGQVAGAKQPAAPFRILGRASADIIKTGGYKVSALDIERVMLDHPCVSECAVVGVDDEEWGQKVGMLMTSTEGEGGTVLDTTALQVWAKERMASYKVPRVFVHVDDIPKNAMGKVNKKALVKEFFQVAAPSCT